MMKKPFFLKQIILVALLLIITLLLINCSSTRGRNIYGSKGKEQIVQAKTGKGFQIYWRFPPTGIKLRDALFSEWSDESTINLRSGMVTVPHKIDFMVEIDGKRIGQPIATSDNPPITNVSTTNDGIINVTIYKSGQANISINANNFFATISIMAEFRGQDSVIKFSIGKLGE